MTKKSNGAKVAAVVGSLGLLALVALTGVLGDIGSALVAFFSLEGNAEGFLWLVIAGITVDAGALVTLLR